MVDEIFSWLVFIDEWINNVRMSNLFGNIEVYFGKIYKIYNCGYVMYGFLDIDENGKLCFLNFCGEFGLNMVISFVIGCFGYRIGCYVWRLLWGVRMMVGCYFWYDFVGCFWLKWEFIFCNFCYGDWYIVVLYFVFIVVFLVNLWLKELIMIWVNNDVSRLVFCMVRRWFVCFK